MCMYVCARVSAVVYLIFFKEVKLRKATKCSLCHNGNFADSPTKPSETVWVMEAENLCRSDGTPECTATNEELCTEGRERE